MSLISNRQARAASRRRDWRYIGGFVNSRPVFRPLSCHFLLVLLASWRDKWQGTSAKGTRNAVFYLWRACAQREALTNPVPPDDRMMTIQNYIAQNRMGFGPARHWEKIQLATRCMRQNMRSGQVSNATYQFALLAMLRASTPEDFKALHRLYRGQETRRATAL